MLAASEVVAAGRRRLRGVGQSFQVCVNQSGVSPPILGGGISEHNFGRFSLPLHGVEQGTLRPGHRVGLRGVGEREHLRDDVAYVLGWLAEAQVELAAHPARHMGYDAVQRRTVLFILVDAGVDVLAEEASALGAAYGIGVVNSPGEGVSRRDRGVFQEGDCIPHCHEPQPHDAADVGGVDQLVNLPRLEPGGHIDVAVLWLHVLILHPDEGPLAPVNGYGGTVGQVAHRKRGLRFLGVGGGIGKMLPVGQQEHLGGFVALELAHNLAGQWSLGADSFRPL